MKPIVLAITGASGSVYGIRLLEALLAARREVHLVISQAAAEVIRHELRIELDLEKFSAEQLQLDENLPLTAPDESDNYALSSIVAGAATGRLQYHRVQDYQAGIASGSFLTEAMVICPCSMGTLSSIANGLSSNLIHRAAHVHLKERRKLIVVPRETPLSSIHLGNMKTLADAGAVVLPAMPGFYHDPKSVDDLVNFVVARICDQLGIETKDVSRWGGKS
jgi:4-hydroxy-3-polyprenylbenzoate decarboxylase